MNVAPEGSQERARARQMLLSMSMRALSDGRTSVAEWSEMLARSFAPLVHTVDERDLRAIFAMSRG